jgi:hypothetical protein
MFSFSWELPNAKLGTDEWEAFVLDVAASRLDREETTARLRKLLKQVGRAHLS